MNLLLSEIMPWLAGGFAALVALIGVYFNGKKTGKSEEQAEVSAKTNQQAAEAAKVVRDVQDENRRLPPGAAAELLHDRWRVRKPSAGGK